MCYDLLALAFGPFCGVLLGFLLTCWSQRRGDRGTRSKHLSSLRQETGKSIKILTETLGNLVPHEIWKSVVYSGDLKVFPPNERCMLSQAYFAVQCYNYEAERASKIRDEMRLKADPVEKAEAKKAWENASEVVKRCRDEALRELKHLSEEGWFKEAL